MKILYTLNSTNYGGMEKTVLDLVENIPNDYEAYVIAPKGDFESRFKNSCNFVEYRKINAFDLDYIFFLYRFIKEKKINVIHANEPRVVFHSLISSYFAGVPVRISHTHTPISQWRISGFKKFLNILINSLVVNLLSTYEIALTNHIKKQKTRELILPNKLVVIPNSLDLEFISSVLNHKGSDFKKKYKCEGKFVITVLSRLTKEKNQILVIEAIYELLKKYPNLLLMIVGKGEDYDLLKKRVRDLNLEENVRFYLNVSDSEKVEFYSGCDLFIFPSLAEGFGITLLEAMYATHPIISSNIRVLREVTSSKLDYFISNNKKSLISKIKNYLDQKNLKVRDPKVLEDHREFIEQNYSIQKYVLNYIKIYNRGL